MLEFGSIMKIIIKNTIDSNEAFFRQLNNRPFSIDKSTVSRILNNHYIPGDLKEPATVSAFIGEIVEKYLSNTTKNELMMDQILDKLHNPKFVLPNENSIIDTLKSKKINKDIDGFLQELIPISILYSNDIKKGIQQEVQKLNLCKDIIVVDAQSKDISIEDIQNFYKGFEASWGCIYKNIPVQRTSYLIKKESILQKASDLKIKPGIHVYTIVGPRGVGKTTLAKQIAVDLVNNNHYAVWADISKNLEQDFLNQLDALICNQAKVRTHLFLKVDMYKKDQNFESPALSNLKNIFTLVKKRPNISVYLVVDALHSAYAFDEIGYVIQNFTSDQIELEINMDTRELTDLIRNLREYNCLGRLRERKESEILELFTNKSNKILLVSLIETIHGMDEKENFQSIIYREYMSLDPETRIVYPIVALCHSAGVGVPSNLLSSALSCLNPNAKLSSVSEMLILHFYGVLTEKFGLVTTKHPLIAKTLCSAIFPASLKQNDSFWLQIIHSLLISIDERNKDHSKFLIEFASEKVMDINIKYTDYLIELANRLYDHEYINLSDENISNILNSIARIFQGKSEYKVAIEIGQKSLEMRNNINNYAKIIIGYCYINIPKGKQTSKYLAEEILTNKDSRPINRLHAIRIMFMAGFPTYAKFYIDEHKTNLSWLPGYSKLNEKVYIAATGYVEKNENNITPMLRCNEVSGNWLKGVTTFEEACELYLDILKDHPFTIEAFANYCHLCFRMKKLVNIIELCDSIYKKISNQKKFKSSCNISEEDIKSMTSMVLNTKAWALYKHCGKAKSDEVHQLFLKGLQANEKHSWGHYWRGIFLYKENNEYSNAIIEIRYALSLRDIPPFYLGLALVTFESNIKNSSKSKNQEVIKLCDKGLENCALGGYWGDDLNNCLELLKGVAASWKGSKDADADLLTAISNINQSLDYNTLSCYI